MNLHLVAPTASYLWPTITEPAWKASENRKNHGPMHFCDLRQHVPRHESPDHLMSFKKSFEHFPFLWCVPEMYGHETSPLRLHFSFSGLQKNLSGTDDSHPDSRESIRANHSQLKVETPIFIARQADSYESLEFPIRANHATKFLIVWFLKRVQRKEEARAPKTCTFGQDFVANIPTLTPGCPEVKQRPPLQQGRKRRRWLWCGRPWCFGRGWPCPKPLRKNCTHKNKLVLPQFRPGECQA